MEKMSQVSLLLRHFKDYTELFRRVTLSLQESLGKNTLSTGDRLKRFKGGLRG